MKKRNHKGVSLILIALGLTTLLGFAALSIDLGHAFNVQNELQKATTTAALSGAAAFNPNEVKATNQTNIKNAIESTFNLAKAGQKSLASAQIVGNIQMLQESGAVRLQTKADVQTFFIKLIGINALEVNSKGAAVHYKTPYRVLNDLVPIPQISQKPAISFEDAKTTSDTEVPKANSFYNIGLNSANDRIVIGGIMPVINGPGPEITVIEAGCLDGYEVLVAAKPTGPWYSITSKGKPLKTIAPGPQAFPAAKGYSTARARFFGSGTFDLEGTGIENVRYVAVFDDGEEDGYNHTSQNVYQALGTFKELNANYGLGADIDAIQIHQHGMSVTFDDLSKDSDSDGYIDSYELLYGDIDKPGKIVTDNRDNSSP